MEFVLLIFFLFSKLRLFCQFLIVRGADHQWDGNLFATAGAQVDIWDHNRFQSPLFFSSLFFSFSFSSFLFSFKLCP